MTAEVLVEPQFQIFHHVITGDKVGRIYFPALFLAEFYQVVIVWLQRPSIHFEERDVKIYGDGSFRLYFTATSSPETEYCQLMKMLEKTA
jgi:hypothetical protein